MVSSGLKQTEEFLAKLMEGFEGSGLGKWTKAKRVKNQETLQSRFSRSSLTGTLLLPVP